MRIKNYFKVSEGTRVTENVFSRVLISSVCSILLSMACLFGTTWAWFSASSEVTDNVIKTPLNTHILVHLCEDDVSVGEPLGNLSFGAGQERTIRVENPSDPDGLGQKSKLCVVFNAARSNNKDVGYDIGYIMLDECVDITFKSETDATLFWYVYWGEPQCWPENMKKDIDELDISEIVIIPDALDSNTESEDDIEAVDDNPDGDNPDGDNPDGENPDGDNPDGENPDGDNPDGDNPDSEDPDGEDPDSEDIDGEDIDSEDPDGDNPDGDNPDGEDPDGDNPDGDNPDGDNPDGDNPDGDNPDGDNTDGDNTDGDNTDGEETT